jgi:hypothetical protein
MDNIKMSDVRAFRNRDVLIMYYRNLDKDENGMVDWAYRMRSPA